MINKIIKPTTRKTKSGKKFRKRRKIGGPWRKGPASGLASG